MQVETIQDAHVASQLASGNKIPQTLSKIALYGAILSAVIAGLALLGWALDIGVLKRISSPFVSMNPVTAVGFIGLSAAVVSIRNTPVGNNRTRAAQLIATAMTLMSIVVLGRYILGWQVFPDRVLFADKLNIGEPIPNVMAPNTAFCFLLLSLSLLLVDLRTKKNVFPGQFLSIIVCFIAVFALLGYAYGSREFTAVKAFIPMAVNTAVCFSLLGLSILFIRPKNGLMSLFSSNTGAGFLLRRLLLAVLLVPAVLGWLRIMGTRHNLFGLEVAVALNTAGNMIIGSTLVWVAGYALFKKEREIDKTKDEFLNLATHQLQTPITGVKMTLEMLDGGLAGKLSKDQKSLIKDAVGASEREARIVNDMLNVARADAGKMTLKPRACAINTLIDDVIREQQPVIDEKAQHMTLKVQKVRAAVDPDKLRMAIENLVSNACKYTPRDGELWIEVYKKDGTITIRVGDSGIGIADEDLSKLFIKFSRLNNSLTQDPGGTGLGLYLVRYITELHGGTVNITSTPGSGSVFTLEIPFVKP